jgi:succinate dehydrogenase/fumarate reductase flavoprotein subunit
VVERIDRLLARGHGERWHDVGETLRAEMTARVGVYRERPGLERARGTLHECRQRYADVRVDDHATVFNTDLVGALELGNLLDVGEAVVTSALAREESRGSHFRTDFPTRDDAAWLRHTLARRGLDGIELSYKPVAITTSPPAERTY